MTVQRLARKHQLSIAVAVFTVLVAILPAHGSAPQVDPVDIKTFVTQQYFHGVPYDEARAYGSAAVPELVAMLNDPAFEEHWEKIVFTLGCIGDPSAVNPLRGFLKGLKGEISVHAFRATLAVFPALGQIAYGGDDESLKTLMAFTQAEAWVDEGLEFGYARYRGDALGEVYGRMTVLGLGLSGNVEAYGVLDRMQRDDNLRSDWRDNVEEALALNDRVTREGLSVMRAKEAR